MSTDRPIVIAQRRFLEHRQSIERLDLQGRFEYIFENNLWGSEESRSGLGSTMAETSVLRQNIATLLQDIGAASLLDIPCGDFHWLSQLDIGISYIGADIVPAIVDANTIRYGSANRRFLTLDITSGPLPAADAVLCRDCLVHLSYSNIHRALQNIRSSGARFLLMTHFFEIAENRDIPDGDWRPLNFEKEPFHLPPPERLIVENCIEEDGAFRDKSLALWRL